LETTATSAKPTFVGYLWSAEADLAEVAAGS
jgi:hypothetical protein